MKRLVGQKISEVSDKYVQYVDALLVDLWGAEGALEFRVGLTLRSDRRLHDFTVRVSSEKGDDPDERVQIAEAVKHEVERTIDEVIAQTHRVHQKHYAEEAPGWHEPGWTCIHVQCSGAVRAVSRFPSAFLGLNCGPGVIGSRYQSSVPRRKKS